MPDLRDRYETASGVSSFGRKGVLVAPGAVDINPIPKTVVLLTAGDITVVPIDNADTATIAFVGLPAGYVIPFRVRRVTAATAVVYTIED